MDYNNVLVEIIRINFSYLIRNDILLDNNFLEMAQEEKQHIGNACLYQWWIRITGKSAWWYLLLG